ncbi:hypothetical protein V8G54_013576 [Vigna mungo]|uniref:Aspartic peptidase DDI1-type domain-containing protein n=1 Tax=Vigna mungo TaxID=3915 RepID=A0AAQ3NUB7_VIGMU
MEELDQEILNTFKKVEINIPLLDDAKFLKELCTNKRRIRDNEVVNLGRNVSSLIKKHIEIQRKCKDPGMFYVPYVIGNSKFDNVMLDLGASINVMPLSVFTSLSLGPLKTTGVVIQLANRSTVNHAGVLEDVLDEEGIKSLTIILGRPFMMTTRTKIDVHARTLTMEIGDEKVHFNVLEAMKHPIEEHSLFFLNDEENGKTGDIENAMSIDDTSVTSECDVEVAEITLGSKILPFVVQPPVLELKPLPSHLKYAYLERDRKLPIIISALLTDEQEKQLLQTSETTLKKTESSTDEGCQERGHQKSGITVVKNEKDGLIPTRIQNNWRVYYIDYRGKLSLETPLEWRRRENFP